MIKPKMVLNGECMRTEEVMKQRKLINLDAN